LNLEKARTAYKESSKQAGDIGRQLAFAGIAVIWLFKVGDGAQATVSPELVRPLLFFAFALAADLLQYVAAAALWGYFSSRKENWLDRNGKRTDEFQVPKALNWPAIGFFWIKVLSLLGGQSLLIVFLAKHWKLLA
jgi:hypothetical protein